jgi:transposase
LEELQSKQAILFALFSYEEPYHYEAAQRAAMIYSFFAICKKHEVNPFQWLKYTLENIMSINHKNIKDLYPQNFKNITR